jgi:hypothetical protein
VELFDLEIPIRSTGSASVKADFKALEASAQGTAGKVSAAMDRTATATAGVTGNVSQAAAAIRGLGGPADQAAATLRKMGFSANEVERELKDVVPAANAVERELREIAPAADQAAVAIGRTSSGVVNVTKTATNVTPVLTRMRNVMSAGIATAIGMSGAMGSLGGAMLAFAGGTGAALAVIAAIGAMVVAIRLLTKGMREAEAQQDALTDGLVEQAKEALPDATRATQALTAATNELAEADKRVAANTGVFNFLNDIAERGDPVAKLLATIVNQIGRLPRGRQREAATAVNQGQINSQQALVDLYAREAELVAETIEIRGKNTESVERATSWQAFLNAEAAKSIYTIPQQNALLQASASLTDALTDKKEKQHKATRSAIDLMADEVNLLVAQGQAYGATARTVDGLTAAVAKVEAMQGRANLTDQDALKLVTARKAALEELARLKTADLTTTAEQITTLTALGQLQGATTVTVDGLKAAVARLNEIEAAGNLTQAETVRLLNARKVALEELIRLTPSGVTPQPATFGRPPERFESRGERRDPFEGNQRFGAEDAPTIGFGDMTAPGKTLGRSFTDGIAAGIKEGTATVQGAVKGVADALADAAAQRQAEIAERAKVLGDSLASGISNAIVSVASGGNITAALGGMIQQFGAAVITTGTLMQAAMKALASLNPLAAIGIGAALVAFGSMLAGAASDSFGGGGSARAGSGGGLRPITTTYRVPGSNLRQSAPARESAATGVMPQAPTPVNVTYFGKGRDPGFSRWLTEQVGQSQARGVRG